MFDCAGNSKCSLSATGVGVNEAPVNPHNLFQRFVEEGMF